VVVHDIDHGPAQLAVAGEQGGALGAGGELDVLVGEDHVGRLAVVLGEQSAVADAGGVPAAFPAGEHAGGDAAGAAGAVLVEVGADLFQRGGDR
jgi:hypothetical protein